MEQMIILLEQRRFYDAVHLLVECMQLAEDGMASLACATFAYRYFADDADGAGRLCNRYRMPFDALFSHIPVEVSESFLQLIVGSVEAYWNGERSKAIRLMKEAEKLYPRDVTVRYYLCFYYSHVEADAEQFVAYYKSLPESVKDRLHQPGVPAVLPEFRTPPYRIVEQLNEQLLKSRDQNQAMVQLFSHNWVHYLLPDALTGIIEQLQRSPAHRSSAAMLRRIQKNERLLALQSSMLSLRFSANARFAQRKIRESRAPEGQPDALGISAIVNQSLEILLFRILFSDQSARNQRNRAILEHWSRIGKPPESMKERFLSFLEEGGDGTVDWCRQTLGLQLDLTFDPSWQKVNLYQDQGSAYALLIEMMTELLLNAFTYGDPARGFRIAFTSDAVGKVEALLIVVCNTKMASTASLGTGTGMSSLRSLLDIVNPLYDQLTGRIEHWHDEYLQIDNGAEEYKATVYIKADLLYEEDWTL